LFKQPEPPLVSPYFNLPQCNI